MSTDRAAILATIADEYMRTRRLPFCWDYPGMLLLTVDAWPPEQPAELRFRASYPDTTIVCARLLPVSGGVQ